MQEIRNVKEVIIDVTTELIRENNGNVTKITSRKIAERAEVGLGLINYHFGSKENLITICVQRIINNVVMCFSPDKKNYNERDGLADKERLADWAKQVYDFLFDNYAISSISILGDMQNYQAKSNSVYTQKASARRASSPRRMILDIMIYLQKKANRYLFFNCFCRDMCVAKTPRPSRLGRRHQ